MKIHVIRHGLTRLNKQGVINAQLEEPLAPEGIEQAKEAATLVPKNIKRIYASSMGRARQTAEIINSALNQPISFHDELREVHFGPLAGRAWKDIENGKEIRKKYLDLEYDFGPDGEHIADVRKRVVSFLRGIKDKHSDGEVLIVAHGGIIRLLHALESGTPPETIENASFQTLDLDKILGNL